MSRDTYTADFGSSSHVVGVFSSAPTVAASGDARWLRHARGPIADGEPEDDRIGGRRWVAAETNRLNQAHWQLATGSSVNEDLALHTETIRNRCAFELARNPILAGVVDTFVALLVGENGPTIQVQSDNEAYNTARERLWQEWWGYSDEDGNRRGNTPDVAGRLYGADVLDLWVRQLFDRGEYLAEIMDDETVPRGKVKMRLNVIDPKRLVTPIDRTGDNDVALGIEIDEHCRPLRYFVAKITRFGVNQVTTGEYEELEPPDTIHRFKQLEPGQIRGIPWLATCLQPSADLRDYDDETLESARWAASRGMAWYTDHVDAPFLEVNETANLTRNTEYNGPPGWKPYQMTPAQPSAQYVDYRRERMGDLGRPFSMPLLFVRLTAERHNYSSARMDVQIAGISLRKTQRWISHDILRLESLVAREGELLGLLPARPEQVRRVATWPRLPHVDPQKEGMGERIGMEDGTLSFAQACAARGTDEDTVIDQWKATNKKLVKAGADPLPSPMAYLKATSGVSDAPDDKDDDKDTDEEGNDAKDRTLALRRGA